MAHLCTGDQQDGWFYGNSNGSSHHALCLLSQISSYDGSVIQAPRVQDSMSELSQTFVISQVLKCPLVKPDHMAKSRLKEKRNRFHLLIEGASKSHCREKWKEKRKKKKYSHVCSLSQHAILP